MPDLINRPPHYTATDIEPIDAITAWAATWHPKSAFPLGCVVKYVARHQLKGSPIEDLKKARWFLDRAIETLEKCPPTLPDNRAEGAT